MDAPPSSAAPPGSPPPGTEILTAWPRSAQLAAAFLLVLATALLAVRGYHSSRYAGRPTELERHGLLAYRMELNEASRAELLQLPGVGNSLVDRIEERRQARGGFRRVDDLRGVSGIGPVTLERLRPYVFVRGEESGERTEAAPTPRPRTQAAATPKKGRKEARLTEPIDVNRATEEELQRLPGVGPKMARRIIDERRKRPFESPDDLRRVSGVGPKTLEKLRPYVTTASRRSPVELDE